MSTSWPALLTALESLRELYMSALQAVETPDRDSDVADAVCSTLEILSDVARVAETRLEVRALVHAAIGGLLHEELAVRIGRREPAQATTEPPG